MPESLCEVSSIRQFNLHPSSPPHSTAYVLFKSWYQPYLHITAPILLLLPLLSSPHHSIFFLSLYHSCLHCLMEVPLSSDFTTSWYYQWGGGSNGATFATTVGCEFRSHNRCNFFLDVATDDRAGEVAGI